MPVPVLLKDNKGIVLMIEAVESSQSPDVIWSSIKARWNYKAVGSVENHRRWTASVDPVWGEHQVWCSWLPEKLFCLCKLKAEEKLTGIKTGRKTQL